MEQKTKDQLIIRRVSHLLSQLENSAFFFVSGVNLGEDSIEGGLQIGGRPNELATVLSEGMERDRRCEDLINAVSQHNLQRKLASQLDKHFNKNSKEPEIKVETNFGRQKNEPAEDYKQRVLKALQDKDLPQEAVDNLLDELSKIT